MDIITNVFQLVLLVIWIALIYWTYADARRRIADRFLVTCATVGALFPFIGSLVYLIVRPPEYLEDVRERELGIAASEAVINGVTGGGAVCPHCDAPSDKDFVRCPSCLRKLRESCGTCERPIEPEWRICPYCESDPRQAAAPKAARRTRAAAKPKAQGTGERAAVRPKRQATGETPAARPKRQQTGESAPVKRAPAKRAATTEIPAVKAPDLEVDKTAQSEGSVGESGAKD